MKVPGEISYLTVLWLDWFWQTLYTLAYTLGYILPWLVPIFVGYLCLRALMELFLQRRYDDTLEGTSPRKSREQDEVHP